MTNASAPPVVLLVEDETYVRMTTVDMLEEAGCDVIEAASAREAYAIISAGNRIDMLVSDVGLPDATGHAVYAACLSACPGLPVIFVTGYGAHDLEAELTGNPLVTVLGKPFRYKTLAEAVHRALSPAKSA